MLDIVSDDEDSGYTSKNQTESLPTTSSVPDIAAAESSSVCIHVKQWGESDSVINSMYSLLILKDPKTFNQVIVIDIQIFSQPVLSL